MLIGPIHPGDNPVKIGGAAGNRTRVQSAYFARVYLHSPGKPERFQYRDYCPAGEGEGGGSGLPMSTMPFHSPAAFLRQTVT